MTFCNHANCSI